MLWRSSFNVRFWGLRSWWAQWCTAGTWLSSVLLRSASPSPQSPRSTEASCSVDAPRRLSSRRTQFVILRTFPPPVVWFRRRRRSAIRVRWLLSWGSQTPLCTLWVLCRVFPGPCSASRSARDPKQIHISVLPQLSPSTMDHKMNISAQSHGFYILFLTEFPSFSRIFDLFHTFEFF